MFFSRPPRVRLDALLPPSDSTTLDASTSLHGLMKKYPGGTTNFLRADGTFAAPSGAGETNTASSVGVGGISIFKQKTGVNLEFRSINAASSKLTVALDAGNNEVDLDVAESALTLTNLGGTLSLAKGGTGATDAAGARTALGLGTVALLNVAASGDAASGEAVKGSDTRLTNSRAPNGSASGDLTGTFPGPTVAAAAITYSKIQNVSAANKLLGRATTGAGVVEEITLGTNLSLTGTTLNASGGGSGETNTASNVGVGGVGVFKQKTGVNLEFRNINAGSSKITITSDTGNSEIDVDVAESALTLGNLGGTLGLTKGGTGATDAAGARTALGLGGLAVLSAVGTSEITNNVVTLAKLATVATDTLLGRFTASTGNVETITCTAAGRALLDDAAASDQRTTLGLGSLATLSTVGTTELTNNAVTLAKMATVATDVLLGRSTAGTGNVETIVCTAAGRALLDDVAASNQRTTLGLGTLATLSTVGTSELTADAVTFAKIQNISTNKLVGRSTASSGDMEEITIGTGLGLSGGTLSVTATVSAGNVLPGTIVWNAGGIGASDWLLCDGSAISRSTYATLFIALGTTYGSGNGSTTFNLPDLRGRGVIGSGTGSGLTARTLGGTGGEETHVLTTAEMPSHTHSITTLSAGTGVATGSGLAGGASATGFAGSDGAHNNMPPYIVLHPFIFTG